MKKKRSEKLQNLLEVIKVCVIKGNYTFLSHANERRIERGIDLPTILDVLMTGYEEKRKTTFDEKRNNWKNAIRGKTLDEADVRVIVTVENDDMLIITVMYVGVVDEK